jgi:WD40 repeat protein/energy-coupling factor transporter ATP-binding protein EcfA2
MEPTNEQAPLPTAEPRPHPFDVFLSHNSREKPAVERIAEKLKRAQIEPWLDKWCLTSGGDWQTELAEGLRLSAACAVFVGPHGIGNWEDLEYKLAIDRMAKDRAYRLFLVLLPGLPEPFDTSALPPFLSIRTWVDLRRGVEDTRAFQSLINAVKGLPLGPERPIETRDDTCPYRGLQTFDEEHAEFFFGRDADIQRLTEQLKGTRFIAVIGSSGSGKSSLVRAGVVPELKKGVLPESDTWAVRVFTPGAHPLAALAANLLRLFPQASMNRTLDEMSADERTLHLAAALALAERPAAERVVLVVDQFEEVFTLCQDERERAQFLANLLYAAFVPGGRVVVLLTLRADFYPKCASHPELSARVAAQQFLVSPMDEENLKQAIEEPAWQTGLEFEQGLVETILGDVGNEPGALPLLEHALLELWERRRGTMLTLEAYRESGGVTGAIAKRADAIYDSFTPEQQAIVRRIMLRLTQPGEGTEDTRRRATVDELVTRPGESEAVEDVTQRMATARLLTTGTGERPGQQVIDVSHEALIRGWPRLRRWIEEDRAGLRIHRRLTEAAREWLPARDESLLYRGARLSQAVEWRERNADALNPAEREFLDASLAAEHAVERRRKRVLIGLAAGLVVAVALALLAVIQWRRADEQARIALARQLAAQSYAEMEYEPALGLLLGIEANLVNDSFEVRSFLLRDMQYREHLVTYLNDLPGDVNKIAFSPDNKLLASISPTAGDRKNEAVRLWDAETGRPVGQPLIGYKGFALCLSFSPDGKLLASGNNEGVITLWDLTRPDAAPQFLTGHRSPVRSLAFSPDNRFLASGSGSFTEAKGEIFLWDVASRQLKTELVKDYNTEITALAFSPTSNILASGTGITTFKNLSEDSSITLWDVATHKALGPPLRGHGLPVLSLAFRGDERVLASGSEDHTIKLWDVAKREAIKGELGSSGAEGSGHDNAVLQVQFTKDGETLISADASNHILVRSLVFSQDKAGTFMLSAWQSLITSNIKPYSNSATQVQSLALNSDGSRWASGRCMSQANNVCGEGRISIWDVAAPLRITHPLTREPGVIHSIAFSPDSKVLVSGGCGNFMPPCAGGEVRLWDTAHPQSAGLAQKVATATVTSVAYSPDGKILAVGSCSKVEASYDPNIGHLMGTEVTCAQGEIRLLNPDNRQLIFNPLITHKHSVIKLAFSPGGEILASSDGADIFLWNVQSQRKLGEISQGDGLKIESMALSPDGKTLASSGCGEKQITGIPGGQDCKKGRIQLWDVKTQEPLGDPLIGHADTVFGVAFSPDGKTLASASGQGDRTILLWDLDKLKPVGTFKGHTTGVRNLVFSPDGRILASTPDGKNLLRSEIYLWDVATRRQIGAPLAGHAGQILDIAFSPDGGVMASVSSEGKLLLWDMRLRSWMDKACSMANRNMTREEWANYFPDQPYHKTCPNLPGPMQ